LQQEKERERKMREKTDWQRVGQVRIIETSINTHLMHSIYSLPLKLCIRKSNRGHDFDHDMHVWKYHNEISLCNANTL
jgi:hypothetical protein